MLDLLEIEEDLRAEEEVFGTLPPFHMKLFMEGFQLDFELCVKGCWRAIRVHLDLVVPMLALWVNICCIPPHVLHDCLQIIGLSLDTPTYQCSKNRPNI